MTEQQKLTRPSPSGPGSDRESWVAYATQELGLPASDFADKTVWTRDKIIELVDAEPEGDGFEEGETPGVTVVSEEDATKLRKAPEGVAVVEHPGDVRDALDRATWAVPVEGGYAAENEILETEK